ncbi:hypothetical protein FG05_35091 [Fusarium graminearum]|nr:hypothetical protein FG05_35091 [Fusarium graminearum]
MEQAETLPRVCTVSELIKAEQELREEISISSWHECRVPQAVSLTAAGVNLAQLGVGQLDHE